MIEIRIDKLLRSRRRTVGLEITREAKLVVRAPIYTSLERIHDILRKKRDWILEKQKFLQERQVKYLPKEFIDGEKFYYLGNTYRFKLTDDDTIRLTEYLEFPGNLVSDARQYLIQWYKTLAYEKIKEKVGKYSEIIGKTCSGIRISSARKRLGSCSFKGNLSFSWRLIMAPIEILDYVVVHELVHLEEKNHAKPFWDKVKAIIPEYKKQVLWLKENNALLDVL
jgi:predicted metal-dependent hydrolase